MINKRIPATVVDNFFDNPDEIRNFALSQEFDAPRGAFPGYRTEQVKLLNPKLYDSINSRLLSIFFNQYSDALNVSIESQFQLIPSKFEGGWIHQDSDWIGRNVAGVIYLTPNAPLDAGTSIYREVSTPNYELLSLRNEYYHRETINDIDFYRKSREEFNSHYERTLDVKNVYNRLLMYDTYEFHKESAFFGENKDNTRLTLVFFMTISPVGRSRFPLEKMRDAKVIV